MMIKRKLLEWLDKLAVSKKSLAASLHKIYFVLALPILLTLVFLNPPFQVPDEIAHFSNVVQYASGQLLKLKKDDSQSVLPEGVAQFISMPIFSILAYHTQAKFDIEQVTNSNLPALAFGPDIQYRSFSNTATYSFLTYLPSVIAIFMAKTVHWSVLAAYYFGRLISALACLILATLAIKYINKGKCLAFAILLMPMTLALFASYSEDACIIAYTALVCGLLSKMFNESNQAQHWGLIISTVLLTSISLAKVIYSPFLLAVPLLTKKDQRYKALQMILLGFLAIFSWDYLNQGSISQVMGVNIHNQVQYLLHHISVIPSLISSTFTNATVVYAHSDYYVVKQIIGCLGWGNLILPGYIYGSIIFAMGICIVSDLFNCDYANIEPLKRFILLMIVLGVFFSILGLGYLLWTPVGLNTIGGVQGRYFIPVFLFVTLIFGVKRKQITARGQLFENSLIGLAAIIFAVMNTAVLYQILLRYYY